MEMFNILVKSLRNEFQHRSEILHIARDCYNVQHLKVTFNGAAPFVGLNISKTLVIVAIFECLEMTSAIR